MLPTTTGGPTSSPTVGDSVPGSQRAPEPPIPRATDARRPAERRVQIHGPAGALHVWLGGATDLGALEADVRAVSDAGHPRSAAAVAFGDVARRHGVEVRVIPRVEAGVQFLLVVFGKRVSRYRR